MAVKRRDPRGKFLPASAPDDAEDAKGWTHESESQAPGDPMAGVSEEDRKIVQEAIDHFTFAKSFEELQRQHEKDELEFEGVDMWGADARAARDERRDEATGRTIPAKPTLSANLLDQNLQQVMSEARQARLALTVKPKTGLANTKTSDYFKGLIRSIQVESGALAVRLWALERAMKAGRGTYLIEADDATEPADERVSEADFDTDLRVVRLLDQSTVYWDPYRQYPDNRDATKCLITDWTSEAERLRRWPDKPIIPTEGAFDSETHDWFAADTHNPGQRRVRVGRYYRVEFTKRILAYHPKVGVAWLEQMEEPYASEVKAGAEGTKQRQRDRRKIVIYHVDGSQVLDRVPWLGRYIPVIEVIGKEYFVQGKRRWKGIVANTMDLLRGINVILSSAVEIAGTMPRAPYIMIEGQDEGFEDEWDNLSTTNYNRVHVRAVDLDGKPAGFPQRQQTELQVQGLLYLLRMLQEMYHAVTGSLSPQMRAVNPYDRSGKAIEALQRQGSAGTSNYLDNLATISMPYEGMVFLSAIPGYYDRQGRILRTMGEENDDETAIMLKTPFIRDEDGNPVPVPCPDCQGEGQVPGAMGAIRQFFGSPPQVCPTCQGLKQATKANMPKEVDGQAVEYVDFAEGEFKVIAAIDRSYKTKQEEAMAGMDTLAKAAPDLVPLYADLYVRALGFPGANEIADRIKEQNPAAQTPDELKSLPPAHRARFQALMQQHKQAVQVIEELQKVLQTKQIEQAGAREVVAIKGALQERLEQVKAQGRVLEAQTDAASQQGLEVLRGQLQTMQQEMEQRHERLLQSFEQKHEIVLALLAEQGARETERHSVALHDAAASKAAQRADLSSTMADARKEMSATSADERAVSAEERQARREQVTDDGSEKDRS